MKARFELTEAEMKLAIAEYVKRVKGVEIKTVSFSYYNAGGDPRETSSYSAMASE